MERVETQPQAHTRGDVLKVGVCPRCKVIYKLRTSNQPADGVHRCHECGTEIELHKTPGH